MKRWISATSSHHAGNLWRRIWKLREPWGEMPVVVDVRSLSSTLSPQLLPASSMVLVWQVVFPSTLPCFLPSVSQSLWLCRNQEGMFPHVCVKLYICKGVFFGGVLLPPNNLGVQAESLHFTHQEPALVHEGGPSPYHRPCHLRVTSPCSLEGNSFTP